MPPRCDGRFTSSQPGAATAWCLAEAVGGGVCDAFAPSLPSAPWLVCTVTRLSATIPWPNARPPLELVDGAVLWIVSSCRMIPGTATPTTCPGASSVVTFAAERCHVCG